MKPPSLEAIPPSFINLDVALKASHSLAPIAEYLGKSVSLLSSDFFADDFYLCMEPILDENIAFDAHHCTEYMLNLLEQLPIPCKDLLDSCSSRVFDYGIDSGFKDSTRLTIDLTASQLARMAELDIAVKVTVYPYHPDRVLHAPPLVE